MKVFTYQKKIQDKEGSAYYIILYQNLKQSPFGQCHIHRWVPPFRSSTCFLLSLGDITSKVAVGCAIFLPYLKDKFNTKTIRKIKCFE